MSTDSTKTSILTQAEVLFLRYGIRSVTMDDISKELGISKKTLYRFVENKSDLLAQIMVRFIEEHKTCMDQIKVESTDAIDEMLRVARQVIRDLRRIKPTTMYDLQKYYREIWRMVESLHQEHIYTLIKDNLKRGTDEGLYRPNINADIIAKLYVGKTLIVIDEAFFPLRHYDREQLFYEYFHYHIFGIASEKGRQLFQQHISTRHD